MANLISKMTDAAYTYTSRSQGIEYSRLEVSLGVLSFVSWFIVGQSSGNHWHFEAANQSGRDAAVFYVRFYLSEQEVASRLSTKLGYEFSPKVELEIAYDRVGPEDKSW